MFARNIFNDSRDFFAAVRCCGRGCETCKLNALKHTEARPLCELNIGTEQKCEDRRIDQFIY